MLLMLRVEVGDPQCHPVEPVDLVVDADPGHLVAELARAIAAHVGAPSGCLVPRRHGRPLDPAATIEASRLLSGDVVRLAPAVDAVPRSDHDPARAISADVVGGPGSGASTFLFPGRYVIGRGTTCDLVLDDPTVPRRHAVVVVGGDWSVTVVPCAEASGVTALNAAVIDGSVAVAGDDVVTFGTSRLAFRRYERPDEHRPDRLGQIGFRRTPYRPVVVGDRGTETIGPIPRHPEPRPIQLLTVIAPLAAGLVLFAFTRQVQFLAVTLVSPLMMIVHMAEDRRSGRRAMRDDAAEFRDRLVERRSELEALRASERVERWRAAPDVADLLRRAERRTIDLWSRGRGSPDFLCLRLGLGRASTRFEIGLDHGGDGRLRDEAAAVVDGLTRLDDVPITVDLLADGVFAVHGHVAVVDAVVSSLVAQAACLHSPDDLTIAAALPAERSFGWMKWLPHVRAITSPIVGPHLASDAIAADGLVAAVLDVVGIRLGEQGPSDAMRDVRWPRLLLVIDPRVGADPAEVSRLLDLSPAGGVSVVCLGERAADVPHQATSVLDTAHRDLGAERGRLWSTDPAVGDTIVAIDGLRARLADRVARALAPLRDSSTASLASSIPRTVDLIDVLGTDAATAAGISRRWLSAMPYGLGFPIGMGATGITELDLVHDGPHALIGGTSGAGKSELLQAMVASLASRYSSQRLTFLFVDYKGGAASNIFERLPHTVGYVTNLSAGLAGRALTSLRAELDHRMALMEGRAKDLEEMMQVAPAEAPPSLVIVVDELATLVKDVPEFVAGMVDVAQRGRSLGIHLVLATQRPSGAVNENVLANTNLRISLRMLDRSESTAVIGTAEAADIPVPLRGRAFARLSAQHLVPFQTAYGGAALHEVVAHRPLLVAPFDVPHATPRPAGLASAAGGGGPTQLDAVIDAIVDADRALDLPVPRRPWCDALPGAVSLDALLADERCAPAWRHPGRVVAVGLLDEPERQEQRPALVDLEEGGGWLVFGSGGSGKTTVLRTVAASLLLTGSCDDAVVLGLDFASRGLAGLRQSPNVIDVATGDDLEAVTRHIVALERELRRRRAVLATANAEHLTAYDEHREHRAPMPRIVLLIDGLGGVLDALGDSGGLFGGACGGWVDRLVRIVVDGRQAGIHAVITADRRNAVPTRLHAAISNRLVLRHAEEGAYAEHGVAPSVARTLALAPGRGLWQAATSVQIAVVTTDDTSARGQHDALAELASRSDRQHTATLATAALPVEVPLPALVLAPSLGELEPHEIPLGVADVSCEPVVLDLRWPNALVTGPPRSGRSTALGTIVAGLDERHDVFCVGTSGSGLADAGLPRAAFGCAEAVAPLLERLANVLSMGCPRRPIALVIDDLDGLDDPALHGVLDRLGSYDELRIVASVEPRALTGFTTDPLLAQLRRTRRMLVLHPDDPAEFVQLTGVKLPQRPGVTSVPGRGVLLTDRVPVVVQVAMPPVRGAVRVVGAERRRTSPGAAARSPPTTPARSPR